MTSDSNNESGDLPDNGVKPSIPYLSNNNGRNRSLGSKFFLLGVLAVLLCIPLFMVWGLVKEREHNYRKATAEIGRQWGADQIISGPVLAVPIEAEWNEQRQDGTTFLRRQTREIMITPDHLSIDGNVETTRRTRGIHEAIVYQSQADLKAVYSLPDLEAFVDNFVSVDWDRAKLVMSVSDLKGIVAVDVKHDGADAAEAEPGLGIKNAPNPAAYRGGGGLHVPVDLSDAFAGITPKKTVFDLSLKFKGSQTLSFVPMGETTQVKLQSSWPHPSFSGTFLPTERTVSDAGFSAEWTVPKLARSIPKISEVRDNVFAKANSAAFGVRFYQPVDFYRLVDRAVKYGVLFISMAFLVIFAVEILSKGRMHAVHYTMSGMMVIMFYVLLLALAEMIGFTLAYGVAAGATGAVLAGFVASVFGGKRATSLAFGGFTLLYGLLFMVLQLEDAALLAGAITGFVILAAIMFATRNVDWSGNHNESQAS